MVPALALAQPVDRRPGTQAAAPTTKALQTIIAQVLSGHPTLRSLEQRARALQNRIPQVRALADPVLRIEASNMPTDHSWMGAHPMSGIQLALAQRLPWPGKIAARVAVERARVKEIRPRKRLARLALASYVAALYWKLARARELVSIVATHKKWIARLKAAVRVRIEVDQARARQLLQLDLAAQQIGERVKDLKRDARIFSARINAARRKPHSTPIATPRTLPAPSKLLSSTDAIVKRALRHHPSFALLRSRQHTSRRRATRASREKLPDLTFFLGYRLRTPGAGDAGTDFVSAGFSMPLSVFSKSRWSAVEKTQTHERHALIARQRALADRLRGDIAAARQKLLRAKQRALAFEKRLIPAAKKALAATLSDYGLGRAKFSELIASERQLLTLCQKHIAARYEAAQAALRLDTLSADLVGWSTRDD
jgi:cobalt-zinc-cadmium efflux system outer membrane protein